MSKEKLVVPSAEGVVELLTIAMDDKIICCNTIGELLGMKLVDLFLPRIKNEPERGYKWLKKFFLITRLSFQAHLDLHQKNSITDFAQAHCVFEIHSRRDQYENYYGRNFGDSLDVVVYKNHYKNQGSPDP